MLQVERESLKTAELDHRLVVFQNQVDDQQQQILQKNQKLNAQYQGMQEEKNKFNREINQLQQAMHSSQRKAASSVSVPSP